MKPRELLQFVVDLEKRFSVAEWRVDGLHVWPLVRTALASLLDDHLAQLAARGLPTRGAWTGRTAKGLGLLRQWAHIARASLGDGVGRDRGSGAVDAVFLTMSTARRIKIGSRWECIFSDPILDEMERDSLRGAVLELAPGGECRTPRRRPSTFVQRAIDWARLRSRLAAPPDLRAALGGSFDELIARVEAEARVGAALTRDAARLLGFVLRASRFFETILARRRPAVGFTYGFYDPESQAFCLACRRLGVTAVDVQHGVVSDADVFYSGWTSLPAHGYEVLPDLFWCWEASDAAVVRAWAGSSGPHRALVGDNLIARRFEDATSAVTAHFDELVASARAKSGAAVHVLVALQPANGLTPLMAETMRRAPADWCFWVRLHPTMSDRIEEIRSAVAATGARSVDVAAATELPLYALLRSLDVAVTESSSVLADAMRFGVRTVLTHASGVDYYAAQIARGWGRAALTPADALDAIKLEASRRERRELATPPPRSEALSAVLELMRTRRTAPR